MTELKRKIIRVTIILRDGSVFEESEPFPADATASTVLIAGASAYNAANGVKSGKNQMTVEGLRTGCIINYGNGSIMPTAEITIYNLAMDKVEKLMRVRWQDMRSLMNIVRVEAGNQGEELALVFEGNITFAHPVMQGAPNIALKIQSQAAQWEAMKPITPSSFEGLQSVVTMIETIAKEMKYIFENNDVSPDLKLENMTVTGTGTDKIRTICAAAGIDVYIEQGLIAITPQGEPRKIKIPVISPNTGLIGYPTPTMQGVDFRCMYDPMVKFGGIVKIKDSQLKVCNGEWRAFGVSLNLESEVPSGNWHIDVKASHRTDNNVAISK